MPTQFRRDRKIKEKIQPILKQITQQVDIPLTFKTGLMVGIGMLDEQAARNLISILFDFSDRMKEFLKDDIEQDQYEMGRTGSDNR